MRSVLLFEDGKLGRVTHGTILYTNSKRHQIRFYDELSDTTKIVWFHKTSKSQGGVYYHPPTNNFFYEFRQTELFKDQCKKWLTPEYFNYVFYNGEKP